MTGEALPLVYMEMLLTFRLQTHIQVWLESGMEQPLFTIQSMRSILTRMEVSRTRCSELLHSKINIVFLLYQHINELNQSEVN